MYRLEKYLNSEGFLEKSLKIKSTFKSNVENHSKALKSPGILHFSVGLSTVDRDLNHYKIAVSIFGAAYAAANKGKTIYTNFLVIMPQLSQSSFSEEEFYHFDL